MPLSLTDIPQLPLDLPPDADAYAILKAYRAKGPLARAEMGLVLAVRQRHLDLIMSDATRQLETETKVMQGVTSGPLFEFTKAAMLFANGEAHRRGPRAGAAHVRLQAHGRDAPEGRCARGRARRRTPEQRPDRFRERDRSAHPRAHHRRHPRAFLSAKASVHTGTHR